MGYKKNWTGIMERYTIETQIPKEAAYNGQMPIPNVIGMMLQQNDVYPDKLRIDIDDMGSTLRIKMAFIKASELIIKGE